MALNYKLRDPKSKSSSIQIFYYIDGTRKKYGTGISIPVELWNSKDQTIKTDSRILNRLYPSSFSPTTVHADHITMMSEAKTDIDFYIKKLKGKPQTWSEIKSILDGIFKKEKFKDDSVKSNSIAEYTTNWIETVKANNYIFDDRSYSRSTIKTYSEFVTVIKGYEKKKRRKLLFDNVNKDEYTAINRYLANSLDYQVNTIGKFFKNLRAIMNIAYDEEVHSNLFHRSRSYVVKKEAVKNVYLTHDELLKIRCYNDITDTQKIYRDLFLVGCSTMQRYSDYSRLHKDDIIDKDGKKYWILEQQKTDAPLEIELSDKCIEILESYDYDIIGAFPKGKCSGQTMNKYIKIIARLAGVKENIVSTEKSNGVKNTVRTLKCELITSHTSRRTGATLAYLDGMALIDICAITGHKSIASLETYIKPTTEDRRKRAEKMKMITTDNVIQIKRAI